jgi:hypothetical protein
VEVENAVGRDGAAGEALVPAAVEG